MHDEFEIDETILSEGLEEELDDADLGDEEDEDEEEKADDEDEEL